MKTLQFTMIEYSEHSELTIESCSVYLIKSLSEILFAVAISNCHDKPLFTIAKVNHVNLFY